MTTAKMTKANGRTETGDIMNNTTVTAVGRSGQAALRAVTAAMVALLVLSMALETAAAKPSSARTQNNFVEACRDGGGTTKRVGSRVVRCTFADGKTKTCDFNTAPPICVNARTRPTGDANGSIGGGNDRPIDGGVVGPDPNPDGGGDSGNSGTVDGGTVNGGGVVDGGNGGEGAPTAGPLL